MDTNTSGAPGTVPNDLLAPREIVRLDADSRPILVVVVDTEEEFDWSRPHDRAATSVAAMRDIGRAQAVADEFGIRPCYVVDYPVADQPEGCGPLLEIHRQGRCEIGAHLHPWVNPPHEEAVNRRNSFPGNLPAALEEAKLRELTRRITESFGERPVVYKAGRYGIGSNSASILERCGYEVDLSPTPAFDYSPQGGPGFERHPNDPFRFGADGTLLCIPGTGALVGCLGGLAAPVYRLASGSLGQAMRVPGMLARSRLVDRLRLSPEGYSLEELRRLTRFLLARGVRVFSFSFHSPSAAPGNTPYVRDRAGLDAFLERCRRYYDYFLRELDGEALTPSEVRQRHVGVRSTAFEPSR